MKISKKNRGRLGGLIYTIGVLIGLVFNGLAVVAYIEGNAFWGDPDEAVLFDFDKPTDARFASLKCPLLITAGEVGTVTAKFSNPLKKPIDTTVRAYISDRLHVNNRAITNKLNLSPGETKVVQWTVTPDDSWALVYFAWR